MELFDFEAIAAFPPISLDDLTEQDPVWTLDARRRRDGLYSEPDKSSADWAVRSAELNGYVGSYTQAIQVANRALTLSEREGDRSLRARALIILCLSELALGAFKLASARVAELNAFAAVTQDPWMGAAGAFAQGAFSLYGDTEEPDALRRSLGRLDLAAKAFEEIGDIERSILCLCELAAATSRTGDYLHAIDEVRRGMRLAEAHQVWRCNGRLLLELGSAATDQGYRSGVEKTLQKSLRWTQFTGDFWTQLHTLFALGRLHGYSMPPGDLPSAEVSVRFLRQAAEEADHHGMSTVATKIESSLAWVYQKAGAESRRAEVLEQDKYVADHQRSILQECLDHGDLVGRSYNFRISSRLQDGVEDSPDAFLVFDAKRSGRGECVDFINEYRNRAGAHLFDVGPGSVLMFSESRQNAYFAGLAQPLHDAVDRRQSFQDTTRVERHGESFWYRRRIVPSADGAVLTLRDVTAENRIEEALRLAAESAQRSERAKAEFLANMSHEIRTPINGVLGLARLLSESPLSDEQKTHLDDIIGSGDILLGVVGDILDLSKIESRSMPIDLAPIDIGEAISSTVRLYTGQAKEKGLTLRCWIESTLPHSVMADSTRIRQMVANLVGNAVKFTRAGSVTVTVGAEAAEITIDVADSGIGIPADRLESIFDRFQQATAESRLFGGSGLGLTLSKGLVQLMGGRIWAESELGKGSRFRVRLPLSEAVAPASTVACELPNRFDGRKILVVDDNRINTVVAKFAIAKLGCDVGLASNGQEALDLIETDRYDLVFMDVRMPVMDGLEATRVLRRREAGAGRRTTVVALTAGALVEEREECFAAGMDDYVSKPFVGDSLREVLARWLV